jgi:hypothetical protein
MAKRQLVTILVLSAGLGMAACNSAHSDWNKAVSVNSVDAYQKFVQEHPTDEHADTARGKILALQDDQAWSKAQQANTVQGFQDYLKAEGGGIHVLEAKANIVSLERASAWRTAQSDGSPAALQAFLQKYPDGTEAAQARQKLNELAYSVELAHLHSKAAAESKRTHLQARFGTVVHDIVVLPPAGVNKDYTVASSPMSQADANAACATLQRSHQLCKVVHSSDERSAKNVAQ